MAVTAGQVFGIQGDAVVTLNDVWQPDASHFLAAHAVTQDQVALVGIAVALEREDIFALIAGGEVEVVGKDALDGTAEVGSATRHVEHHIGRFVGTHGVAALIGQVVIIVARDTDGVVIARCQAAEHKDAVVIVVGHIGVDQRAALVESHGGAVDGLMGIDAALTVGVEAVVQAILGMLHAAHDVARVLAPDAEVVGRATCQTDALLGAVVPVERAVTGGLIGVEPPLDQEARHTMFQGAQIAVIGDSRRAVGGVVAVAIQGHVARDVHARRAVVAVGIQLVHPVAWPTGLTHGATAADRLGFIGAAVDVQRIIGFDVIARVGVDGNEHVIVTLLDFGGNHARPLAVSAIGVTIGRVGSVLGS